MTPSFEQTEIDLFVASGKWPDEEAKEAEQWLAGFRQGRADAIGRMNELFEQSHEFQYEPAITREELYARGSLH